MHVTQSGARRRGGPVRWSVSVLLAVVLLGTLAGCGDDNGSGSSSSPSPTATATGSPTGTGSPGATSTASPTGTAPADLTVAEAEVTGNWEDFFSPETSLADKARLLQNGDQLVPVLQGFGQDPRVSQVQANVTDVAFTSATEATVTYELTLQGTVVEPAATGQAVLDNGVWKVSRSTLCGLVTQAGASAGTSPSPLPGCS
ncbi:hypothetical protein ACWGB8_08215 [Kitasatospora sp. NPDC054939]